ncbi:MAG: SGNH/GDSL hydrolase family protein [Planctomycetales bacterium]
MLPRRHFCFLVLICLSAASYSVPSDAGEAIDPAQATREAGSDTLWYDLRLLSVEGRGWNDTKAFFDRLPAKAEGVVPASVWGLSRQTAGLCVRFVTDATTIHARWTLTSSQLAMPHMPATGVSGLDLYAKHEGQWRWLAIGWPKDQSNRTPLVSGLPAGEREFLLYLPLYNGVASVDLGLPEGTRLAQADPYGPGSRKPIVFYGTSITQGGCASRPGMVHTAILGRRLNYPVINLGFSGSGRMEPQMATLFAELDPAVFVLDCLPNMSAPEVKERVEPFVATLRAARPATPILLVEDRSYTDNFLVTSKRQRNADSRAALKQAFENLKQKGTKQLYYLGGEELLGDDGEGTVDSSHPTDLGFQRQAEAFEKALRPILEGNAVTAAPGEFRNSSRDRSSPEPVRGTVDNAKPDRPSGVRP